MRIACQTVPDFLSNLEAVMIHRSTIHVDRTEIDANDAGTAKEVIFAASAVAQFEDGSDALVELAASCGIDRESDGGCHDGSKEWSRMRDEIEDFCIGYNLRLKPGIIGF